MAQVAFKHFERFFTVCSATDVFACIEYLFNLFSRLIGWKLLHDSFFHEFTVGHESTTLKEALHETLEKCKKKTIK